MRITKISRDNVCTPGHEEFEPKQTNIFTGPNGSGKSAWLKTIRSCLSVAPRGQDFTGLLADDAVNGKASIIAADVTIVRDVSPVSSPLRIKAKGIGEIRDAKANVYVKEMFDAESINAEAFLTEDKKERVRLILEAIPFTLDEPAFRKVVGDGIVLAKEHPLLVIDDVRSKFYEKRTVVKRDAKQKRAASEELGATIKSQVDVSTLDRDILMVEESIANAENARKEKIEAAQIRIDAEKQTFEDAERKIVDDATAEFDTAISTEQGRVNAAVRELERQIKELEANYATFSSEQNAKLEKVKSDGRAKILESRNAAQNQMEAVRSEADAIYEDAVITLNADLANLRASRDGAVTAQAQREIATRGIQEAALLEAEANDLTWQIDAIDEFKNNMLKELPIPGIELDNGEIKIDGKLWDHVPDSRRVILAIDLAIARSSDSGILLIDKLESIDDVQFKIVVDHLRKCGRQSFVGRASVGTPEDPIKELRIVTLDAE